MQTNVTLHTRGIEASKKFLEKKGYTLLDSDPRQESIDLVARFDNTVSIIKVATREATEAGFPEEHPQRSLIEFEATQWLAEHDSEITTDVCIRFDSIAILVLSESRALLRLHTNYLGTN